jgi:Arc/MetJ family transcription regulator
MGRSRTNIELDDDDLSVVMRRYRLRTKSEAVALALRRLAGEPMTRDEALAMQGVRAIAQIPPDQPPPEG